MTPCHSLASCYTTVTYKCCWAAQVKDPNMKLTTKDSIRIPKKDRNKYQALQSKARSKRDCETAGKQQISSAATTFPFSI